MKIAIYARVSTTDQNCERQLTELREYAGRRGWEIAGEYVDTGWSGAKTSRPQLDKLMADARQRRFDTVIVWALDRWGRSISHLLKSIEQLSSYGVAWMSFTQNLDTSKSNPTGQLILHILGAVAQFEREMIRERVNSGLASYRKAYSDGRVGKDKARCSRSGKNLPVGRPKAVYDRQIALDLSKAGKSIREIVVILRRAGHQASRSSVHRLLSQKP
jgi:putative DNA-invertase from lambdoid prophage Rac